MYMKLQNISKKFGAYQTADSVSFSIEKGGPIGLLGPSGSGKATILRIIARLETSDSGTVIVNDWRVNGLPASGRGIGFVLQNYALFRYMMVSDNIAFGLEVQRRDKDCINGRIGGLIELIGLEGLERHRPYQLSDRQWQRVAFACTLVPSSHLLLLDEPFAAINAKVRKELRSWLRETINRVDITSIFVTHDQEEAVEVADKIIITNQGRIEQIGAPVNICKNPTTSFAAKFIGESTEVEDYGRLHGFENEKGYTRAVLRPEFVRVTKIGQETYPYVSEHGVVEDIFFRGNMLELRLNVDGVRLVAYRSLEDNPFVMGEEVSMLIYRLHLYSGHQVHLVESASLKGEQTFVI